MTILFITLLGLLLIGLWKYQPKPTKKHYTYNHSLLSQAKKMDNDIIKNIKILEECRTEWNKEASNLCCETFEMPVIKPKVTASNKPLKLSKATGSK